MRKSLFNSVYDDFLKKDGFSCKLFQKTFPETIGVITIPQIRSRRNLLTCGDKRKNRVKTYHENYSKRFLQNTLMSWFAIKNARVVALLGPAESYTEYKEMLYKYIKPSKIESWETDYNIFSEQQRCNSDSKIKFNYGDVYWCKVSNYMDIDLKCTYKSCRDLITNLFQRQKSSRFNKKVFHFTYSVNWLDKQDVEETIITSIRDLVGKDCFVDDIKIIKPDKGISIRQYFIKGYADDYIIRAFWYYDSSPMVSISIFTSNKKLNISRSQKETLLAKEEPSLIPLFPTMSDGELDLNISWYGLTA